MPASISAMMSTTTVQSAMDAYIRHTDMEGHGMPVEQCFEMLSQYLIHYSDLFNDADGDEDVGDYPDWEEGLDEHMSALLEGDLEPVGDLGNLLLEELDPEHIRDFLGWFVLRETNDEELLQSYAAVLHGWVEFVHRHGGWPDGEYPAFVSALDQVIPASIRVSRLSRVLFHLVRSGGGVPPRLRGHRFSRFVEGHAQASEITESGLYFSFHNQGEVIGPVSLPAPILSMIEVGDVFDLELGLRGDTWVMVDVGPVYPSCVYVEVEEYQGLEKLS
ncbi:hypothetical protein [Mariprofundus erugo]|nr:hypothetical protein [Mariprofundus erugo]